MDAAKESVRRFLVAGTPHFVTRSTIDSKPPAFGQLGRRIPIFKASAAETFATKAAAGMARKWNYRETSETS
jgi:hypothetical protein